MKDYKERFKELYTLEILERGGSFTPLLNGLFEHILKYDFNDNAELMDEFVQSIARTEKTILQKQIDLEKSVLEITNLLEGLPGGKHMSDTVKDLLNDA